VIANQTTAAAPDHSNVVVFPPVIPVSGFLLGVLLETLFPIGRFVSSAMRTNLRVAGTLIALLGAAGLAWMVVTMKRARTPIHTARTPTALVESGPFRFTRNPMYLFGSTAYAGLALLFSELWSLALLPFVLLAIHVGVVLREEAYLSRKFGADYDHYRRRVRRWL
jgi:protein-S-isoprenylcysteine O-methyltransferase Ste14